MLRFVFLVLVVLSSAACRGPRLAADPGLLPLDAETVLIAETCPT